MSASGRKPLYALIPSLEEERDRERDAAIDAAKKAAVEERAWYVVYRSRGRSGDSPAWYWCRVPLTGFPRALHISPDGKVTMNGPPR